MMYFFPSLDSEYVLLFNYFFTLYIYIYVTDITE